MISKATSAKVFSDSNMDDRYDEDCEGNMSPIGPLTFAPTTGIEDSSLRAASHQSSEVVAADAKSIGSRTVQLSSGDSLGQSAPKPSGNTIPSWLEGRNILNREQFTHRESISSIASHA